MGTNKAGFEFKAPLIYKDPENKKWFVYYSVRYKGEKYLTRRKVYDKNLNREKDLRKRHENVIELRDKIHQQLKNGIDPHHPNRLGEIREEEKRRYTFDELFKHFCDVKGYSNPEPRQERTAANYKLFFNRFRKFLIKNNLERDLRKVERKHILNFVNYYYLEKKTWNNTTYNNAIRWIGALFSGLIYEDRLQANPCKTIKSKPKKGKARYEVFTKDELQILFDYLDKNDFNLGVICKMIYYAYIRGTELERIKVSCIDLEQRVIRIPPNIAKGSSDGLEKDVMISQPLAIALSNYLALYPHLRTDYLFGKKMRPSVYKIGLGWSERFTDHKKFLQSEHPGMFDRDGLTIYSLKHSGVTHFFNDNMKKKGSLKVLRFIQSQCRHQRMEITQLYLRKLPISLTDLDDFDYEDFYS